MTHPVRPRPFAPLRLVAFAVGVLLVGLGVLGVTSNAMAVGSVHAPIVGSGSTWSANALQQWIRNVWANYQWKLTYTESGSTQGRNDFANGTADFGVSEIPYAIANSNEADRQPARKFAYMPIVAGGTAFMYNLEIGGKRVTNLRLSGATVAKIFTGVVTTWNDPAIAEDNPSLALPAIPIVPVVRSDGSGATAQVSIWLRQEQSALWDAYCGKVGRPLVNGHCGVTSNYPVVAGAGMVSKSGSNGVAGYVAQPQAVGAITFVEYSYALNSGFPVAKILNSSGYYTEPTAANVAVALLRAKINEDPSSSDYLTQDLSGVYTNDDRRTYPLSSYSYIILPTAIESGFTENKGLTLADFGSYFLCEGQQSAEVLGYSPLPINLVKKAYAQDKKIPGGNVADKDPVKDCNNPTFSPGDSEDTNRLAKEAPYPQDCDRKGSVAQCTTGTGGAKNTATTATAATNDSTTAGGSGDAATAAQAADGAQAATGGGVVAGSTPVLVNASPQTLATAGVGFVPALAALGAGLALLAVAVVPTVLGRRARRSGWSVGSGGAQR